MKLSVTLTADPDLAAVLADMNRAVHRLHRGVREEWNLIGGLDLGDGARHGLVDIADVLGHCPELSVAFSSSPTMSSVLSLACGPSSHSITRAASPFFAAPIWSATTATASSSRTIWRTPLTASRRKSLCIARAPALSKGTTTLDSDAGKQSAFLQKSANPNTQNTPHPTGSIRSELFTGDGLDAHSVKRIISAATSKFFERYATAISTAYGPTRHMILNHGSGRLVLFKAGRS